MTEWDFAGDEVLFMLAAGALAVIGVFSLLITVLYPRRVANPPRRAILLITPLLALGGLYWVLQHWADPKYVVGHNDYILLFMLGGAAWLSALRMLLGCLGVSLRDDAIERGNLAATWAIAGAMLGIMCVYAGGNVGAGPTIWTTILPALVASLIWLVLWLTISATSPVGDSIAIDRDVASGVRQAGVLIAMGLVLGRAIAGDWTSWESTFSEMATLLWPAVALAAVAVILHRALAPSPTKPRQPILTAGFVPALILILLAIGYLIYLGPADIGKHIITYEEYMNSR